MVESWELCVDGLERISARRALAGAACIASLVAGCSSPGHPPFIAPQGAAGSGGISGEPGSVNAGDSSTSQGGDGVGSNPTGGGTFDPNVVFLVARFSGANLEWVTSPAETPNSYSFGLPKPRSQVGLRDGVL